MSTPITATDAEIAHVKTLKNDKCRFCWDQWKHTNPANPSDVGKHDAEVCRSAMCGRCSELACHYEKNCPKTGLLPTEMCAAFEDDDKTVLEQISPTR